MIELLIITLVGASLFVTVIFVSACVIIACVVPEHASKIIDSMGKHLPFRSNRRK